MYRCPCTESCRVFIEEFEHLYQGRDVSKFPLPNPMRSDGSTSVGNGKEGVILFPTDYKFRQDYHGTGYSSPDITAISTNHMEIRVVGDLSLCMDAGFGGTHEGDAYMGTCAEGNPNQKYYYDPNTFQIKHTSDDTGTRCLDYDSGGSNQNVYLNPNCFPGLNQKWKYNPLTLEISTFINNNCLDWNQGDPNLPNNLCECHLLILTHDASHDTRSELILRTSPAAQTCTVVLATQIR